jgi:hypothetical protein
MMTEAYNPLAITLKPGKIQANHPVTISGWSACFSKRESDRR